MFKNLLDLLPPQLRAIIISLIAGALAAFWVASFSHSAYDEFEELSASLVELQNDVLTLQLTQWTCDKARTLNNLERLSICRFNQEVCVKDDWPVVKCPGV